MARPSKQETIDKSQFEKLCSILCTENEIADFFGVSHDTLNRWCRQTYNMCFMDIFSQKSSLGKISLRRMQFKQAETNSTMAIFLGKQILGQKDVIETTNIGRIEVVNDVPDIDENSEVENE